MVFAKGKDIPAIHKTRDATWMQTNEGMREGVKREMMRDLYWESFYIECEGRVTEDGFKNKVGILMQSYIKSNKP